MPHFVHPWELVLVLAIVIIVFGVGRLPEVGGAMGKAIREFKSSVTGSDDKEEAEVESGTQTKE
jgi:sec-independent protein translocase protein TatA